MKKLCELKDDEKVIVKYKEGMTEVIDAGEIESCIAYNEGFSLEFYTAVKDTVQINERELITKLTEMLGNDQYEDWEDDMYYELIDERETKEFVEAFNRAAEKRATYCIGEAIDLENRRSGMDWISVKDDMPKEEDSVFVRCYGTTRWTKGMFRKISKKVLVTFEMEDGNRETMTGRTQDGVWKLDFLLLKGKVTHWMPFPEPAKGE